MLPVTLAVLLGAAPPTVAAVAPRLVALTVASVGPEAWTVPRVKVALASVPVMVDIVAASSTCPETEPSADGRSPAFAAPTNPVSAAAATKLKSFFVMVMIHPQFCTYWYLIAKSQTSDPLPAGQLETHC